MSDDKNRKNRKKSINKSDESTDEGSGGHSGSGIEFYDFLGVGVSSREETLSPAEKKQLLSEHISLNESLVKKQKKIREDRKALKEGKVSLDQHRQGLQERASQYRSHPILSNQAQFSGIDRQVNVVPTEQIAETNQEKAEELRHQYQLTHKPQQAPKFNPKPQR